MSDDRIREIQAIFLEEMAELINDIEKDLLLLESSPDNRDCINSLFRNLHTIKGGAGVAGMEPLAHYTHDIENMLDMARKGSLAMTPAGAGLLLETVDCLKGFLAQATGEGVLDQDKVAKTQARILDLTGGGSASPMPEPVEPGPCPAAGESSQGGDAGVFLIQVFVRPDDIPGPGELLDMENALGHLGELVSVSHVHSLGCPDPPGQDCLWHSFHLSTAKGRPEIEEALESVRHRLTVTALDLAPEAPADQAAIDAVPSSGSGTAPVSPAARSVAAAAPPPIALRAAPAAPPGPPKAPAPACDPPPGFQAPAAKGQAAQKLTSIRVDIGKLDKLVNLVGEMITTAAGLDRFQEYLEARDPEAALALRSILDDKSRTLRELQDHALNMRMVPIGTVFDSMHRLVRDYCRQSGKQANLTVIGQDTEVDKKVSEQISGPLKHLLRNALDHGLETPIERLDAGKPMAGEIGLRAYQQFGLIIIEVKDDGRGIDLDRVLASAKAKGIVAANAELTGREIMDLIFAPAVSTAEAVTEVSGRGVGMDVVKRDIEAMRGTVEIESELGRGTTVTVAIPLTLAIIDGLLVRIGQSHFVVPLSFAEEHLNAPGEGLGSRASNFLDNRDELIPLLSLRELFNVPGSAEDGEKVVVVSTGERRVGLVVDQLLGYQQTVIKPLSPLHSQVRCFSGATILGDGSVALILDVLHLIELGQAREDELRSDEPPGGGEPAGRQL